MEVMTMTRFTVVCISLIVVSLMFVGLSYAKIDPGAVIGIWFLDDDQRGVAKDSSGNGHDGEIIGDLKVVKAKFNQGFEFDGVLGNYVSVPLGRCSGIELPYRVQSLCGLPESRR